MNTFAVCIVAARRFFSLPPSRALDFPLEAMKCGSPVICSNTSSLPEVAGDAAIMIDPKDEAALANAIVEVVSNPARQDELRAQSLRRATAFSWKASAAKVAEAYELAVSSGRLQKTR